MTFSWIVRRFADAFIFLAIGAAITSQWPEYRVCTIVMLALFCGFRREQ